MGREKSETPSKKLIIKRLNIFCIIWVQITWFGTETQQHPGTWEVLGRDRFGQHRTFCCLS